MRDIKHRDSPKSPLTRDEEYAIYELEEQGYTQVDIAKMLNVSKGTVNRYLVYGGSHRKSIGR